MKGEWCYWVNAFSPEECDQIIQEAIKLPENFATLGEESIPADKNFRRSMVRWIDYMTNPEFTWLYHKFWQLEVAINKDWFGFNVTSLPPIQFTEYDESYQGEYKSHQDVFWLTQKNSHRKVSLILQLTDPSEYEGGVLNFERIGTYPSDGDKIEMKKRGTVIAFPSFIYHRLEPVTKGRRHSLVGWFEGPRWQ